MNKVAIISGASAGIGLATARLFTENGITVAGMGTRETVKAETKKLLDACAKYQNFVLSSGCDIPPMTPWENIDAFFEAAKEFNKENA